MIFINKCTILKKNKVLSIICAVLVVGICFFTANYVYMQNKGLKENEVLRLVTSQGGYGIGGTCAYYVLYEDRTLSLEVGVPKGDYSPRIKLFGKVLTPSLWEALNKMGVVDGPKYRDKDLKRNPFMKEVWENETVKLSKDEYDKIIELADKVYDSYVPGIIEKNVHDERYYQVLYKDKLTKQCQSGRARVVRELAEEIRKFFS